MPKADFVCAPTLRVRWAEVDMQKIVFTRTFIRNLREKGILRYRDEAVKEEEDPRNRYRGQRR